MFYSIFFTVRPRPAARIENVRQSDLQSLGESHFNIRNNQFGANLQLNLNVLGMTKDKTSLRALSDYFLPEQETKVLLKVLV